MTLHTKAATDDILDIFNQPLRNVDPMAGPADSAGESDYEDDDYTSAGESTGTGRISGTTSEFGDTEADLKSFAEPENTSAAAGSVSPWSDFTASKHVPKLDADDIENEDTTNGTEDPVFVVFEDAAPIDPEKDEGIDLVTPISPERGNEYDRPRYVPIPPEDYEPPTRPYRGSSQVSQNRLPFMTPIVEKTESSMVALTIREEKDYFNSKTPSRHNSNGHITPSIDEEFLSSPFQEIVNEASPPRVPKLKIGKSKTKPVPPKASEGPVIRDGQCNPVDDSIRKSILENVQPPLSSYPGYHDYRPLNYNRGPEIRKFIKALTKKNSSDKTTTNISLPPALRFPQTPSTTYTIKRELGKGAFAPVYLASNEDTANEGGHDHLVAIKCEHPPTPWEFHIMSLLAVRLHSTHRASPSLLKPHSLHLFADEAYLLETYLDQGTLLDLVNLAKSDPSSVNVTGTLDESVAMFFTIELLRTVEAMHSIGILHGDLKADNCMLRLSQLSENEDWDPTYQPSGSGGWSSKGLCLIDFGRGIDMRAFRPDVQFVADWKTGKQDCVEMRELRPWTYQVDYYGIAGVIHSLLFGKYIEDVAIEDRDGGIGAKKKYKLREGLKRYWQVDIWAAVFELLLNPMGQLGEGERLPCTTRLAECRQRLEAWLAGEGGRRNGGLKAQLRRFEDRIRERKGR
jgi:checkpoint serine/threonine-protein kinase